MPKHPITTWAALLALVLPLPQILRAETRSEPAVECANFCAFSEFENHCQGVRFKLTDTTSGESKIVYTIWNRLQKTCTAWTRTPLPYSMSPSEADALCKCPPQSSKPPKRDEPISDPSKNELLELRSKIETWSMCAPDPLTHTPNSPSVPFLPHEVMSCASMKDEGITGYMIPGGCVAGQLQNCSYYPNTNNLSGVFCFAGNTDRCEEVRKSQDPVTGAWYRNAYQRLFPDTEMGQPLFSRDEFMGVMFYLLKTRDRVAAEKFMRFLGNNPKKPLTYSQGLIHVVDICPQRPKEKPPEIPDSNWTDMLSDDRCEMRPPTWAMMAATYEAIGFTPAELKRISPFIYKKMKRNKVFITLGARTLSNTAPAVGGAAYESALQAGANWIATATGHGSKRILRAQGDINRRTGYISPYFHYLASGGRATEYGAYLIKKYCPVTLPYAGPVPGGIAAPAASFFDMGMRSFGGLNEYGIQSTPTGHDCLAWIDLYTK